MDCLVCLSPVSTQNLAGTPTLGCSQCGAFTLSFERFEMINFRAQGCNASLVGPSHHFCSIHDRPMAQWNVVYEGVSMQFHVTDCGLVHITQRLSPKLYAAISEIPGDVSFNMSSQDLLRHLLQLAALRKESHSDKGDEGPYRSQIRRFCKSCGVRLTKGYGAEQQLCESCYPIQQDELVDLDDVSAPNVVRCPLCSSVLRQEEPSSRDRCLQCRATFVSLATLHSQNLDPFVVLTEHAGSGVKILACPRCRVDMTPFSVETLSKEIDVDVAYCCQSLFFEADTEDAFIRRVRIAMQEEADRSYGV